jgi:hypothetical protein
MIQYLKDSDRVIKLDDVTKDLTVCLVRNDQMLIRHEVGNPTLYDNILTQGPFITATEEEYLAKKAEILSAI